MKSGNKITLKNRKHSSKVVIVFLKISFVKHTEMAMFLNCDKQLFIGAILFVCALALSVEMVAGVNAKNNPPKTETSYVKASWVSIK